MSYYPVIYIMFCFRFKKAVSCNQKKKKAASEHDITIVQQSTQFTT